MDMSSPKTPFKNSEEYSHTTDVKPSPSDNASQVKEEVPLNGDHIVAIEDDNPTPHMGDLLKYDSNMSEESEDPLILEKMKIVATGVAGVGIAGNFAFLQVGGKTIPNHLLKRMHFASNLSFGVSSLTAAIIVLIICIITPKSSMSIKKLKYALRVAILLVIIGYVLAVTFILLQ